MTEEDIQTIWNCTKKDQQTKIEIFKIIQSLVINLKDSDIEIFMDRFAELPEEQFTIKEIECIHELTKFSHRQNPCSMKAANILWRIATQSEGFDK